MDFVPTIDLIWFNPERKRPLWAHTTLTSIIHYRQQTGETVRYKKDVVFDETNDEESYFYSTIDIDIVFDMNYQRRRLTKILKNLDLAEDFITETGFEKDL